ncbi:MAG: hypothetical protein ACC662_07840 [Planctomycetota bacterium]
MTPAVADLPRRGRVPPWLPLLVVVAAWLAQGGVLRAGWVNDDVALVRDLPQARQGIRGVSAAFARDAWGGDVEPGVWRPLALASLALEAPLWRGDDGQLAPGGFHLTNLLLHGFCGLLILAVLLSVLGAGRWPWAAATALLFVVHPLATGTIAAMGGRADLLAGFFGLVAVLLWIRARKTPLLLPLVALAFFLALLAKETILGLPWVLLLLDLSPAGRAACGWVWGLSSRF